MDELIKKRFVGRILQEEGHRLLKNQGSVLYKKLRFHDGTLRDSRHVKISGGASLDGQLTYTHVDYERFLDMKRKVKKKRSSGFTTRRGYRIHNRFVYGTYSAIAYRLMYDLTDNLKESIREELKAQGNG